MNSFFFLLITNDLKVRITPSILAHFFYNSEVYSVHFFTKFLVIHIFCRTYILFNLTKKKVYIHDQIEEKKLIIRAFLSIYDFSAPNSHGK